MFSLSRKGKGKERAEDGNGSIVHPILVYCLTYCVRYAVATFALKHTQRVSSLVPDESSESSRPSRRLTVYHPAFPDYRAQSSVTELVPWWWLCELSPTRVFTCTRLFPIQMRAGTQTLIQALQALPWTDPDNEDDVIPQTMSPIDSDSDEEGKPGLHAFTPLFATH
jgi:hypothetical protein